MGDPSSSDRRLSAATIKYRIDPRAQFLLGFLELNF